MKSIKSKCASVIVCNCAVEDIYLGQDNLVIVGAKTRAKRTFAKIQVLQSRTILLVEVEPECAYYDWHFHI